MEESFRTAAGQQCSTYLTAVSQSGCNLIYGQSKRTNEPRLWSQLPHSDMRTSCLLSFCSYLAYLYVSYVLLNMHIYIYFFHFLYRQLSHALCYSLSVWASSQINCHALAANKFWEAERESLSKLEEAVAGCRPMYRNACLGRPVHPKL